MSGIALKPVDPRSPKGGYASGGYMCHCYKCGCHFIGDKRAYECADCAYTISGMKLEKTQHIMHYMNGREAKENDNVICKPWSPGGPATAGKIHSLNPGCTSCNGQVAYAVTGGMTSVSVTVGDCIHADDALAAVLVSLAPKADAQNTTAP